MNILIYALTIKKSGAFKVLQSFLFTISKFGNKNDRFTVVVSYRLKNRIKECEQNLIYFENDNPLGLKRTQIKNDINDIIIEQNIDLVYSIGSPSYFKFNIPQVNRLTEPYVLHPNKYAYKKYTILGGLKTRIKTRIKHLFLRTEIYFETQTFFARNQILKTINSNAKILVLGNTMSSEIFDKPIDEFSPENRFKDEFKNEKLKIFCLAYPYPHKDIFGALRVASLLKNLSSDFVFYYTIPESKTKILNKFFCEIHRFGLQNNVYNLGEVYQRELSLIYNKVDIVYQSSLLETSSSTLIEALFFEKLILCADLPYNREICKNRAFYFEPLNYQQNAELLHQLLSSLPFQQEKNKPFNYYDSILSNYFTLMEFFKTILSDKKSIS